MTQEIKQKFEQAALTAIQQAKDNTAQTIGHLSDEITADEVDAIAEEACLLVVEDILQNPSEFGLVLQTTHDHYMKKYQNLVQWHDKHHGTPCEQIRHAQEVDELQSQLAKYRSLLSELTTVLHRYSQVWGYDESKLVYKATEALKQEGE